MCYFASKAVLSKVRALYGKRLTNLNYKNLISCNTIEEIIEYLKTKTNYSYILGNIDRESLNRIVLERLLKKELLYFFDVLSRYDLASGENFFSYMIIKTEIQEIMYFLTLLLADKTENLVYNLPSFFSKHTKINFAKFSKINNFSGFLDLIKKTCYYKLLKRFEIEDLDLNIVETILYTYLYDMTFGIIRKYLKSSAKKELLDLFNVYIDLMNIVRIFRAKKYYNLEEKSILRLMFPFGNLGSKCLREFIETEDSNEFEKKLKESKIGKKWFKENFENNIDKIPKKIRFKKSIHNIRFSMSSPVVLMSYVFLKEIEITNIINIIESVKYKLPKKDIYDNLIYNL
ncbi:MAG: V-type ATPase subunit [Candidatus Paraimprobicoccus trichonymphae]|uniref:V-type ATPase subunit n=1 Tax=Candidatus Paraimprobicoccus trichonymphae TaxID=3033793 RepID=A0AA48I3A2_9FIRM|nr:MAG: V-type ATPase subunit [Candidatus Paraimprobicoccus trichonymphae]